MFLEKQTVGSGLALGELPGPKKGHLNIPHCEIEHVLNNC